MNLDMDVDIICSHVWDVFLGLQKGLMDQRPL